MRRQNILSWVKSQEVVIAILYHTTDNLSSEEFTNSAKPALLFFKCTKPIGTQLVKSIK